MKYATIWTKEGKQELTNDEWYSNRICGPLLNMQMDQKHGM